VDPGSREGLLRRRRPALKILLDTCVLLWWLEDNPRLGARAKEFFRSEEESLLWSIASSWEIAIKVAKGQLRLAEPIASFLPRVLEEQRISLLPITHTHVLRVSELPRHHGDPFDRILISQAIEDRIPILTSDPDFADYEVETIW